MQLRPRGRKCFPDGYIIDFVDGQFYRVYPSRRVIKTNQSWNVSEKLLNLKWEQIPKSEQWFNYLKGKRKFISFDSVESLLSHTNSYVRSHS